MKAKKENKVYSINTEQEKKRYLEEGYDIYDDAGRLMEYSPKKKIAYSEYAKASAEVENLKNLLKAKEAEIEAIRAETAADQDGGEQPSKRASQKKAGE